MKFIPTKQSFLKSLGIGLKAGAIGGISVGLSQLILGNSLGSVVGGIVGGAIAGEENGRVITINGCMDGIISLFHSGQTSGSSGEVI